VDAIQEIRSLVAFEGRGPGTDAERRASLHLEGRLHAMGRAAESEPIWVNPSYALTHLLHALLAAAASVASVFSPLLATALLAVTLASTLLDLTGRAFLVRRLTPRRASQNVLSTEDGVKPGTIFLVAHYDAGRTGAIFGDVPQRLQASIARLLGRPIGGFEVLVAALVVTLVCSTLRAGGLAGVALSSVQFAATVVLLVAVLLLADTALSGITPGASDNASGVACALGLVERHGGALEHFDLRVLFPGAGDGLLLGTTRWLSEHRRALDPRRTIFVGLDRLGAGTVRYARSEGFVGRAGYRSELLALCDELASEPALSERTGARPARPPGATDAHAARRRGFPAIALSCADDRGLAPNFHQASDTPENVDPAAVERAEAFCSALIERIDERIGPAVAAVASELEGLERERAAGEAVSG
jgi:hypothetical protein